MKDFEDVVQTEAKEINSEEYEKIKEKIVIDENERHFKFYENLRKKFQKSKFSQSIGGKISDYLFLLPDFFMLLLRLFRDDRVLKKQKIFIGAIIAYVISPIDIIPDFIPIIGYVDDLVLVIYALNSMLNEIDQQVLIDNWSGDRDMLEVIKNVSSIAEKTVDTKILKKIKFWISNKK